MLKLIISAFLVLHGLVHLLYFGQSRKFFELQSGMEWPEGSWAFSRLIGDGTTRWLASIFCLLAATGFVAGGAGIILSQSWQRPLIMSVAAFSAVSFILFWNGKLQKLDNQGMFAILINLSILFAVLILHWPDFKS
jgi:hypothetical protein